MVWPLWVEMFLMLLMGSSDTWMLSGVSDEAVAAAALANQYIMLALLVLRVVTVGTQVVLSQSLGAQQWETCRRVAASSLAINFLVGCFLSVLLAAFHRPLLRALHTDPALMADASAYLSLVGGFLFVQAMVNGVSGILKVYGYAKETMWVSVGMNVVNVLGNGLLIFGWTAVPAMGVTGAALATVISRIAAFLLLLYVLGKLTGLRLSPREWFYVPVGDAKRMASIGGTAALETMTYHAAQTVFLGWISMMGPESLAARQYVVILSSFVLTFGSAMSAANAIVVGKLAGAGNGEGAYHQTMLSVRWSFLVGLVLNLAALTFGRPLLGLFTSDPLIVGIGVQLLWINLLLETGKVVNYNAVSALRSVGDAPFTMWAAFVSIAGISLPAAYWLSIHWDMGLAGIWLATALDECIRGGVMLLRWRSRRWQRGIVPLPLPRRIPL
ncbi:MATE family efflux transporter [Paenibacillus sp. TRM 82003]|nr:MATE family efflux transporter [Paenibacillus sp. TRM 82003]